MPKKEFYYFINPESSVKDIIPFIEIYFFLDKHARKYEMENLGSGVITRDTHKYKLSKLLKVSTN